jgi:hypothetical protein
MSYFMDVYYRGIKTVNNTVLIFFALLNMNY